MQSLLTFTQATIAAQVLPTSASSDVFTIIMRKKMDQLKYFAAMALFEQFHNENKDVGEIVSMFILQYLKRNKKYLFSIDEITNDVNKYYNFKLPLAVIDIGISKIQFIAKDENSQKYFIKGNLQDATEKVNEDAVEKKIRSAFDSLVRYVEARQKRELHQWDKTQLLNALTNFLLEQKVDEEFKNYISAFFLSCDGEVKQQLELVADGMVLYTGITSDVENCLPTPFTEKMVLYLDMEILFHLAGYNGTFYKQQFDDFYKLVQEINGKEKKIELKYFSQVENEIHNYFQSADQILNNKTSNDYKIAMQEILKGCRRTQDIFKKKILFKKRLEEYGIKCDYNNYHETIDGKNYQLKDAPEESVSFINVLRKGQNFKPIPLIGYILISGTSNLLDYRPCSEKGYKNLVMTLSYITKFLWFSLNKGFGCAQNMISFDIVCRAKMALSFNMNKIVIQRCQELNKQYQENALTKDDAACCIAEYRRYSKLPEDIEISELESDLKFIDDNSLSRIQNEISQKDNKIEELESSNENLKKELDLLRNEKRKKEKKYRRVKGVLLLIVDNLLLFVTLALAIFDYVVVVIPYLNGIGQGWAVTISILGGCIITWLSWKKMKSLWLCKVWMPFMILWEK